MKLYLGIRSWPHLAAGMSAAALCLITLAWPDWIEIVVRVDPDRNNGVVEWVIAGTALVVAVGGAIRGVAASFQPIAPRPPSAR